MNKSIIEIDQSGKIEDTSKDTVLALSNGTQFSILISRKIKRDLQTIFRKNKQPRNFVLFTFSAGLSILIHHAKPKHKLLIDKEYLGKEFIIKKHILETYKSEKIKPIINFGLIGKGSNSHKLASLVVKKKSKPNLIVSKLELLQTIKMTEVGKQLKST